MLNKFPLIIVDESVDARISATLRKEGFNIICIQEIMPGTADIDIIKFAIEKEGYIVTEEIKILVMNLFLKNSFITVQCSCDWTGLIL